MTVHNKVLMLYDIEVFQNIFTCTCCNSETGNIRTYEISEWHDDHKDLIKLFKLKSIIFVGYNNHYYDDVILNAILSADNDPFLVQSIYTKSKEIIESEHRQWDRNRQFESIDLMAMLFSSKLRVSLKELQMSLGYHNVEEFDWSLAPNDILPIEYHEKLINYNINDVLSTKFLLDKCHEAIQLRLEIENTYHINALSRDGMKIGIEILKKFYCEETKITTQQLLNIPTSKRDCVPLKDCILDKIKFTDRGLQSLLQKMKADVQWIDEKGHLDEYGYRVKFNNKIYHIGSGGLHTDDSPGIFKSTSKDILLDLDVSSYYPSLMIAYKFIPEHLGKNLLNVYKNIYKQRLKAKKAKKKTEAETLKLALNGTFGNLLQKYGWLYDPKAGTSITVNGQLLLLMLVEQLAQVNIPTISANTDGITVQCPIELEETCAATYAQWEKETKMELERTDYDAIYRRDVNSYIAIYKGYYDAMNDEERTKMCKLKGFFKTKTEIGKGLEAVIIPKALFQYFVHGIPIETTIKNCTEIKDFLMAQRVDKKYNIYWGNEKQQRINRFYVTDKTIGRPLTKRSTEAICKAREISLCANWPVQILNRIDDKPITERHIGYNYYLQECRKVIERIKTQQLKLF